MSEYADLPEWVWTLLDALDEYEETHPLLYRLGDNPTDGSFEYVREPCFGALLSDKRANPPAEVRTAAAFRRQVLRRAEEQS